MHEKIALSKIEIEIFAFINSNNGIVIMGKR